MRFIMFLCAALLSIPGMAFELKPFDLSYTADFKQVPVSGSAESSLESLSNNRWTLRFEASMLIAGISEESTFEAHPNSFIPISYAFERSGLGKSKSMTLDFDWPQKQAMGTYKEESIRIPLNPGLLDKSTYQLALQRDVALGKTSMSYLVIDDDQIETYDFRVLGTERVRTRVGLVDALEVERVRDPTKSARKTTFWLAKDWNYVLVRLHQIEKDGKEYQIMLKNGSVDGQEIQGASQ